MQSRSSPLFIGQQRLRQFCSIFVIHSAVQELKCSPPALPAVYPAGTSIICSISGSTLCRTRTVMQSSGNPRCISRSEGGFRKEFWVVYRPNINRARQQRHHSLGRHTTLRRYQVAPGVTQP